VHLHTDDLLPMEGGTENGDGGARLDEERLAVGAVGGGDPGQPERFVDGIKQGC